MRNRAVIFRIAKLLNGSLSSNFLQLLSCAGDTAAKIDDMVVALVKREYEKAEHLLSDHMPKLHELAKYLYEKETITGDEFMKILNEKPLNCVSDY